MPGIMSLSPIHRRLSLPTGTETLRLREALSRRQAALALEDLFALWGYLPVETPLVDYFEVYRRLLPDESTRATYRTVDRAGEVLMVRPDTTMFVAKQLGIHLHDEELPLRVYYNEQILRHENEDDLSRNEYQQAGVELVGVQGSDGDAEVLLLLAEALKKIGAGNAVIHVGSHAVIDALIEAGMPPARERDICEALRLRDGERCRDALTAAGLDPEVLVPELFAIHACDPSAVGLRGSAKGSLPSQVADALEGLETVVRSVAALVPDVSFRIDPSEVGWHDYYTGIAFAAYTPDSDDAVARGGRYDDLLGLFGFTAPSVGFSLFARKIPAAPALVKPVARAVGTTVAERYADARSRRQKGEAVTL